MSEKFKGVKKFIFETSVIIIGISISFWLSNLQEKSNNKNKEIEILESIDININEIQKYIDNRRETFDEDNQLMDYLSTHWNNLNLDSIVEVLQFGRHKKAFHNVFLDYREFHPPVSEISSIIGDGSISLISNHDVKIQLISLMDSLIYSKQGELILDSKLIVNIDNIDEAYRFLLTPKIYRNELSNIKANLVYNFDQNTLNLNDILIDNQSNPELNKILQSLIFKNNKLQNRVYLKSILNKALKFYAG